MSTSSLCKSKRCLFDRHLMNYFFKSKIIIIKIIRIGKNTHAAPASKIAKSPIDKFSEFPPIFLIIKITAINKINEKSSINRIKNLLFRFCFFKFFERSSSSSLNGYPHFGQLFAFSEIILPQSGHCIKAMQITSLSFLLILQ